MFGNLFSGWHIVIIVALVVLLFGATKLPALAKSLGESVRVLRKETETGGAPAEAGSDSGSDSGSVAESDDSMLRPDDSKPQSGTPAPDAPPQRD